MKLYTTTLHAVFLAPCSIQVEAFDLAGPSICSVRLDPNQNMKLTLGIRYLRITGNISRKRLTSSILLYRILAYNNFISQVIQDQAWDI